jgi:transposase
MNMIAADKRKAVFMLYQSGMTKREIARRLRIARNTVRTIIKQKGIMPSIVRSDKIQLAPDLLRRLHKECKGQASRVREKLTKEHGVQIGYSTLSRTLRELGLLGFQSRMERKADDQRWLTKLIRRIPSIETIEADLDKSDDLAELLHYARNGRPRQRKKAIVVLAWKRGLSNHTIAGVHGFSRNTIRKYLKIYCDNGLSVLFGPSSPRSEVRIGDAEKTPRILELLHHKPRAFGINRTSWTHATLIKVYETEYQQKLSRRVLCRVIKKAGYRWRKARRVLTSPDPDYREKVERVLQILLSLDKEEMFFFLDEWGPVQVKKRGGRAFRSATDAATIPRRQKPKGTVTLVAALSATTNQTTWLFETSKDTRSMINLLELLFNQYHEKSRLYITWDAVSWHSSIELTEWLDHFNGAGRAGPVVELVPLPTSAQFLNVIEGVFAGMTKAVIHNSDYHSCREMKSAISQHFRERNAFFSVNPRRAGKKMWDMDFFNDFRHMRAGDYREW